MALVSVISPGISYRYVTDAMLESVAGSSVSSALTETVPLSTVIVVFSEAEMLTSLKAISIRVPFSLALSLTASSR